MNRELSLLTTHDLLLTMYSELSLLTIYELPTMDPVITNALTNCLTRGLKDFLGSDMIPT